MAVLKWRASKWRSCTKIIEDCVIGIGIFVFSDDTAIHVCVDRRGSRLCLLEQTYPSLKPQAEKELW